MSLVYYFLCLMCFFFLLVLLLPFETLILNFSFWDSSHQCYRFEFSHIFLSNAACNGWIIDTYIANGLSVEFLWGKKITKVVLGLRYPEWSLYSDSLFFISMISFHSEPNLCLLSDYDVFYFIHQNLVKLKYLPLLVLNMSMKYLELHFLRVAWSSSSALISFCSYCWLWYASCGFVVVFWSLHFATWTCCYGAVFFKRSCTPCSQGWWWVDHCFSYYLSLSSFPTIT